MISELQCFASFQRALFLICTGVNNCSFNKLYSTRYTEYTEYCTGTESKYCTHTVQQNRVHITAERTETAEFLEVRFKAHEKSMSKQTKKGTEHKKAGHVEEPAEPAPPVKEKGIFSFPDGSTYDGEYITIENNKLRHGVGRFQNGPEMYDGEWANDVMCGKGIYRFCSGAVCRHFVLPFYFWQFWFHNNVKAYYLFQGRSITDHSRAICFMAKVVISFLTERNTRVNGSVTKCMGKVAILM